MPRGRWRCSTRRWAGCAVTRALERVDEIGAYRLGRLKLSQVPPNRMAALARYALGSKAPLLELVEERGADPDVAALWAALEEVAPRAAVMTAAATVISLVPEDEGSAEVAMRAAREPVRDGASVPVAAG